MTLRLSLLLISAVALAQPSGDALYRDPAQPVDKRVDDLLSRMTLEEKVSQMMNDSAPIDRLGVPAYNWWNECLHGVARAGVATVFPQAIGMAASWNAPLLFETATAISDEARAKHHEFLRQGKRGIYQGLTFWTPNINIFRDPRWGRGQETYGEDPYLAGQLAIQFVRGLQGDDPKYLKTIATAKHYAVHSGPESTRHSFDARVSDVDLLTTYLPQFEAAVRQGGAMSVMCAYNRFRGDPACASPLLEQLKLRRDWRFPGYIVSDCGAIWDIYQFHKVQPTAEAASAAAVKAGTDLTCGTEYNALIPAVKQGLITEKEIDVSVRRLLTARFRLGMFDPPEMVPYAQIPYSVNDSLAHGELAARMARESVVLLKNEGNLLPLSKSLKSIAVIGPNADSIDTLLGNYNGEPSQPITPLEGIRRKVGSTMKVLYAQGSDLAAGAPVFQTVPASALFTSNGPDRKPGLSAEYFSSANFNGRQYRRKSASRPAAEIPSKPAPLFTRVDSTVDFHWKSGAPRDDMDGDNFGVRWTGYLAPTVTGKYYLGANGMNAYEVYLDGKQVARRNDIHERAYDYSAVELEAGRLYELRVEFHEYHNDADIRLVWSPPRPSYESEAVGVAQQADAVVMMLGLSPRLEGEQMKVEVPGFSGGDRITLGIPQVQEDLLKRILETGKPVVLVLLNGSAVAVNNARRDVPAILELWYPGQAGGTAIADVLFGDYNPAGRLPVTFYQSEQQLPAFDNYDMKGRTYRYFEGQPLWAFGYGMSYTKFAYSDLRLPAEVRAGNSVTVSAEVRNVGDRAGDEVAQLYLKHKDARAAAPIRSLQGFARVSLKPGERRRVEFTLSPDQLALIGEGGRPVIEPGEIEIAVGGGQPGQAASTTEVLTGACRIVR
ncbi:MAG: glycoside hydrolase family 3 C-terminal domain-containing protein [Acidobacteria bacterium]|nr:glycoside hydrolase family 3 C-terminal domain-containing protein [Acidobacteriota bacterium]